MKTDRKSFALGGAVLLGLALGIFRMTGGHTASETLTYTGLIGSLGFCLITGVLMGKAPAPDSTSRSDLFKTAIVLAAMLTMGASLLRIVMTGPSVLGLCGMGLMVISGIGMILGLKETDSELPHLLVSVPIFACGLYLLDVYKTHVAANPSIDSYAVEILAVLFLTMALYCVASMRFLDRSRSIFITTSILGAVLLTTCVIIGGNSLFTMADLLLCAGLALYCGASYLNPPVKYIVPDDENDEGSDDAPAEIIVPHPEEE